MTRPKLTSFEDLDLLRDQLAKQRQENRPLISICSGTGCRACGCEAVAAAFQEALRENRLENEVGLKTTGCHGFCERGTVVVIYPEGIFYQQVQPGDAKLIVDHTIKHGQFVNRLLYRDPQTNQVITRERDIPFYEKQMRLITGKNGLIDPESIDDYIVLGGYRALVLALSKKKPEDIVDEILKSELRGRGGGGFPTGWKWEKCRESKGEPKYVICNADEGDPGAFMDRSILESNPHSVIEGMIIGAYAVGSHEGYVYVRNEYPLAYRNLTIALASAREYGFLGDNILGTGFKFDIEVSRGGGAFVCGESTALMASLEGKIGEPRAKYIHSVEAGLWDKPSNLNNVETWANVPLIIEKGAAWYSKIGTKHSKGTKVFALTGKVNNTGLVEVPFGTTLREILYDIGGGLPKGRAFKAVHIGGPAGGTLIVETREQAVHDSLVAHGDIREDEEAVCLLDVPVDFDELTKAGSTMGSGGMVVMDQDSCMVDMAKYFIGFLLDESCGKCIPCREGLRTMMDILIRISEGRGEMRDLDTLEEISQVMIDTSLCQLGGTAPNPLLSTLRYFRHEYVAHIEEKRCPAGACKELVSHAIDETCNGCHECYDVCPIDAVIGQANSLHSILQEKCNQCGACFQICRFGSIKRVKRGEGDALQRLAKEKWQPLAEKRKRPVVAYEDTYEESQWPR